MHLTSECSSVLPDVEDPGQTNCREWQLGGRQQKSVPYALSHQPQIRASAHTRQTVTSMALAELGQILRPKIIHQVRFLIWDDGAMRRYTSLG